MEYKFLQQVERLATKSHKLMNLIESGARFGVFGTGKLARESVMKIRSLGGNPALIVERQSNDKFFQGLPVHAMASLSEDNTPLLIASSWAKEVIVDLRQANYNGEVFVIDPFVTVFERMTETDKALLLSLYSCLADDESREVLNGLIAFRCGDVDLLSVSQYPQYFSPLMPYSSSDVLIDGGGYTGDTIKSFYDYGVCLNAIHSFEPDVENYNALAKSIENTKQHVQALQMGLWFSSDYLNFSTNETVCYGRKIEPAGGALIPVISIDEYCTQNKITPSVIKLDIEGAEQAALQGAEKVIRYSKPKLAVSVYHVHSDLWRLPAFIKTLNSDYKFSLGHHRSNWMETVVYGY